MTSAYGTLKKAFFIQGREQLGSTTVQSQFYVEGVEFVLDVLGTGAVLPCTEIQQDVDLQETDKPGKKQRVGSGIFFKKQRFREQDGRGEGG